MSNRLSFLLLTPALFAAAFFVVWKWPADSSGGAKAAPEATRPANAAQTGSRSTTPRQGAWLATRVDARKRAAALTPEEARAIMERLTPPVPEGESAWLTEALRRWTESDPEAALEWLGRWMGKVGSVTYGWDTIVLAPLARKDLPAAIAAFQKLSGGRGFHSALLAAAAESDPAGTMAFVAKHPALAHEGSQAFRVWLQRDAAAACLWLNGARKPEDYYLRDIVADIAALAPEQLPAVLAALAKKSDQASETALGALAALEVDRDPAAALAKFGSLSEAERLRMMEPLALHLATRGTGEEITALLKSLTGDNRLQFISRLGDDLNTLSGERLLSMLRLPELAEAEKARLLMSGVQNLKPENAEEVTAMLNSPGVRFPDELKRFWTSNLQNAPEATLPVLNRMLAEGKVDSALLMSITGGLIRDNAAGAEKMIAGLPENQRAGPQALVAVQAALSGKEGDLAAYQNLPDAATRKEALRAVFNERQGDYDPVTRAAFLRQLPPAQQVEALTVMTLSAAEAAEFLPMVAQAARAAGDSDDHDLIQAVSHLAVQMPDPAAALQWLDTLPPGAAQNSGRLGVFSRYAWSDAIAASAWLAAQPPDLPQHDEMTGALVNQVVQTDPSSAWKWAAAIRNEAQRHHTQEMVMERWRKLDPDAASKAAGE